MINQSSHRWLLIATLFRYKYLRKCVFFSHFFVLLTHEGSQREVYQEFQPSYDIVRRFDAKGCSDHRFRAPLAYTAQLLTLHQHRANNQ